MRISREHLVPRGWIRVPRDTGVACCLVRIFYVLQQSLVLPVAARAISGHRHSTSPRRCWSDAANERPLTVLRRSRRRYCWTTRPSCPHERRISPPQELVLVNFLRPARAATAGADVSLKGRAKASEYSCSRPIVSGFMQQAHN